MKLKLQVAVSTAALLFLQGCAAAKPNVEVSIGPNVHNSLAFEIQAIGDEATIKEVVINRGNCPLGPITQDQIAAKVKIRFGESYRGYGSCPMKNVKEIRVTTNAGAFTFSF